MRSTTSPHASLAVCCPTNPLPKDVAVPSSCTSRPVPRSRFPSFSTHARGSPSHDACTCFVVVSFHARVDRVVLGQPSSWSRAFLVTCETTRCVPRGRASLHQLHRRHERLPFHAWCPRRRHGRLSCAFLSRPKVLRCHLVGVVSRCVIAVRPSHLESQSSDVGVGGHALLLSMAMRRGHLFDAHHRHATHKNTHVQVHSLSLPLSPSHSQSLSPSLKPSHTLSLSPSHTLSHTVALTLTHSFPSLPLSLPPSIEGTRPGRWRGVGVAPRRTAGVCHRPRAREEEEGLVHPRGSAGLGAGIPLRAPASPSMDTTRPWMQSPANRTSHGWSASIPTPTPHDASHTTAKTVCVSACV